MPTSFKVNAVEATMALATPIVVVERNRVIIVSSFYRQAVTGVVSWRY